MSRLLSFAILLLFTATTSFSSEGISPDEAISLLKEGNARFMLGNPIHPNINKERRIETTENGQHPFATVIACSDSRVPVEMLFDQGIGDIFVIKVAGNVCDVDEIASIEYGVDHLGTPVLVVLGHSHCGAVTAVCEDAEVHGSIPQLVDNIVPVVKKIKEEEPDLHGKDLVDEAVAANVFQSIDDLLKNSKATRDRVKSGKLKIVGAVYDIHSGSINWLGQHKKQKSMLKEYHGDGGHEAHAEANHENGKINIIILITVVVISTGLVVFGVWGFLVFLKGRK